MSHERYLTKNDHFEIGVRLIKDLLILVLVYGVMTFVSALAITDFNILDFVTAVKISALIILALANGEIARKEVRRQYKNINYFFCLISIIIAAFLILKMFGSSDRMEISAASAFETIAVEAYWISLVPVFLYFLLDILVYTLEDKETEDATFAFQYIIYVDVVCVLPLFLIVIFAVGVAPQYLLFDEKSTEILIGGAVIVVLLSSAVSARALDLIQEKLASRKSGSIV